MNADSYESDLAKAQQAMLKAADAIASGSKAIESAFNSTTKNSKELMDTVDGLGDAAKETGDSFGKASKETEKMPPPLDETEKSSKKVLNAFEKLVSATNEHSDRLSELKLKYANLVLEQGEETDEAEQLGREIAQVSGELVEHREKLNQAIHAADKYDATMEKLDETVEDAGESIAEATEKVSIFGDLLKANLASDAIKAGVKKLASAIVGVGKASLDAYAENEQLVGGIKKLYGDAYKTVVENGNNAWETAGMSANQYFNNVTGFSAALLTSLNGDAEEAARVSEMIMTDIADNANTFGKYTAEELANVYQNIAKGQYQTLDNLMLGFAGTKEGLQELISTANDYKQANGEMADLSIDNFADIAEAIHIVQDEMGIAGTTAAEAEGTIEGSTNAMKAAWENLATGMADETADMEQLTQNFVDSVEVAAQNIIPRVKQIAIGVVTSVMEATSYLRESNEAIDIVVTGIENIGVAAAIMIAGFTLQKLVTAFEAAKIAVAALAFEVDGVTVAQMALNGTMTVGQAIVGVMTGQISIATLATQAWTAVQKKLNAAIAANPVGAFAVLVAGLVVSIKGAKKAGEEYMQQLTDTDGTLEGVIAKYNQLSTELAGLEDKETELGYLENEDMQRKMALEQACASLESQLAELTDAETAAAIASGEMSAQTLADAEAIQTAAETYSESVQQIIDDYYSTFQNVYDGLHNTASAFTEVATATEITWADAMSNIDQNTQFLERMDDNMTAVSNAANNAGINIDGFKQMLSQMNAADAAGLVAALAGELEKVGVNSTDATAILNNLSNATARYADSGTNAASLMAVAVEDVDTRLAESLKDYTQTVEGFDQSAEAVEAAVNTLEGLISGFTSESPAVLTEVETLIDQIETNLNASEGAKEAGVLTMDGLASGIESSTSTVLSKVDSLASQMKSRLQSSFSGFTLNISAIVSTKNSHKNGLDYVPFDGYIAELHKGERVLTAEEASAYRAGKTAADSGSGIVINQYIQTPVETPAELAASTEAYFKQARWALAL